MLEIADLDAFYGDFQALFGIGLKVEPGQTLAVVGANGAGKTSLLRAICGLTEAHGQIKLDGRDITELPAQSRARAGIALSPEGRRMFTSLRVFENLLMGATTRRGGHWTLETVYELFPILDEFSHRPAGLLSGGQQQMVAIGRALMANPAVLLLDEISLGLAPLVTDEVYAALAKLRSQSSIITLLVEQDIQRALAGSDRFICLLEGKLALEGDSKTANMDEIGRAYFGEEAA